MLELVTGVPGSGKTYKAVNTLFSIFKDEKSTRFKENTHFYTNINEFRFDLFPDGVGYQLNFDDFYSKLTILHLSAVDLKFTDTQLKEQAKELGLLGCLVVIDEAQNFFDRDDKTLVWWISYHRHLSQNIILLTQSLDLLNSKYKRFSEGFLCAVPSSLRLFGSVFRYKRYIKSTMYPRDLVGTEKIKFNQQVYELYHSGANTQSSKVIWKFLGIAIFAALGFALAIYLVKLKWSPKEPEKNETVKQTSSAPASSQNNNSSASPALPQKTYEDVRLLCGEKTCVIQGVTLTNADVDNLKRKYDLKLLSITPFTSDFSIYIYRSNKLGVLNEILAGTL